MKYRSLLAESGAIVEGHFQYASERCGAVYINKTAAFAPSSHAQAYGKCIADYARTWGDSIKCIVAPEFGAIALMTRVADDLAQPERVGRKREIYGIIATKIAGTKPQRFEIARDQARFVQGRGVLVVEDLLTTGESARETVEAVRRAGGDPIAVAALWNRGSVTAEMLNVSELFSIVEEVFPSYERNECPQCQAGIPFDTILGKGKKAVAA
ncbi:MAG TPA: phosphoribosyltransferase family protein [Candidatus Paceibacterota bacterium]|nr:phosphoribosyltransferase family protein [Candidatus Paceibacterota bacterium]